MSRLSDGALAPEVRLATLAGDAVVPQPGTWTHLSILRFASCPMCNLRVRELHLHADAYRTAGVQWFAVFHSPHWRLERHMPKPTWPHVVADPDWTIGRAYATTRSWSGLGLSVLLPSFYWAFARTLAYGYWGGAIDRWFHSMPADFVIDPAGRLRLAHYGRHIGDHVSVSRILSITQGRA